jgi:hypothetical protein
VRSYFHIVQFQGRDRLAGALTEAAIEQPGLSGFAEYHAGHFCHEPLKAQLLNTCLKSVVQNSLHDVEASIPLITGCLRSGKPK